MHSCENFDFIFEFIGKAEMKFEIFSGESLENFFYLVNRPLVRAELSNTMIQ